MGHYYRPSRYVTKKAPDSINTTDRSQLLLLIRYPPYRWLRRLRRYKYDSPGIPLLRRCSDVDRTGSVRARFP